MESSTWQKLIINWPKFLKRNTGLKNLEYNKSYMWKKATWGQEKEEALTCPESSVKKKKEKQNKTAYFPFDGFSVSIVAFW